MKAAAVLLLVLSLGFPGCAEAPEDAPESITIPAMTDGVASFVWLHESDPHAPYQIQMSVAPGGSAYDRNHRVFESLVVNATGWPFFFDQDPTDSAGVSFALSIQGPSPLYWDGFDITGPIRRYLARDPFMVQALAPLIPILLAGQTWTTGDSLFFMDIQLSVRVSGKTVLLGFDWQVTAELEAHSTIRVAYRDARYPASVELRDAQGLKWKPLLETQTWVDGDKSLPPIHSEPEILVERTFHEWTNSFAQQEFSSRIPLSQAVTAVEGRTEHQDFLARHLDARTWAVEYRDDGPLATWTLSYVGGNEVMRASYTGIAVGIPGRVVTLVEVAPVNWTVEENFPDLASMAEDALAWSDGTITSFTMSADHRNSDWLYWTGFARLEPPLTSMGGSTTVGMAASVRGIVSIG